MTAPDVPKTWHQRVVIYTRKSTAQDGAELKSVKRQEADCRTHAERNGWTVVGVYEDDAISGALEDRPSWQRMLADAGLKRFDTILVAALDRAARDPRYLLQALWRLADLGVTMIEVATGQPIDVDDVMALVITTMRAGQAKGEHSEARRRVKRKQREMIELKDGRVVYGSRYGYDHARLARDHVERLVNPEQAAVVRRIFADYAAGVAASAIVGALNRECVKPPRKPVRKRDRDGVLRETGRKPQWNPTTVRVILRDPIYRGEVVYGRTRKAWGRRELGDASVKRNGDAREVAQLLNPEERWTRVARPDLRIVDEAISARVDARLAAERAQHKPAESRAPHRGHGTHLASGGVMVCGLCHGNYEVADGGYVCASRRRNRACTNSLHLAAHYVDGKLIEVFDRVALGPQMIAEALRLVATGELDPRPALEARLGSARTRRERLVRAIASGTISEDDAAAEAEKTRREIAHVEAELSRPRIVQPNRARLKAALEKRIADWRDELRREPRVAREVIRRLLAQPIVVSDRDLMPGWAVEPGAIPPPLTKPHEPTPIGLKLRPEALLEGILADVSFDTR